MRIIRELDKLLQEGVVDQATADRIREYYRSSDSQGSSRIFTIFGIIGALLIGLGIILIVAHNWDNLSRPTKLVFSFLPTIASQILCFYVFRKRLDIAAWREASATLLFLSIGATIALVAQVYHMPSNMQEFLLTWMLLVSPLIYLMRSSFSSLLFLIGITWLGWLTNQGEPQSAWFWLLLLFAVPKYVLLWISGKEQNALVFHHWLFVIAILTNLWSLNTGETFITFILYLVVLGFFYQIGEGLLRERFIANAYLIAGSVGTAVILLMFSFDFLWTELVSDFASNDKMTFSSLLTYAEFWWSLGLALLLLFVLWFISKSDKARAADLNNWAFVVLTITFFIAISSPDISRILINLFILILALSKIKKGVDHDSLLILNYGLLLITALIVCRFFDTDLSFVLRGLLFITVGAGFFVANYFLLKKRSSND